MRWSPGLICIIVIYLCSDGKQQLVQQPKHFTSFTLMHSKPGASDFKMLPLLSSFSSVIVSIVYIPPQVDIGVFELHEALTSYQTLHRDAVLIVVGDFNCANLKRTVPNFHQHIICPTRGDRTLDHCYTQLMERYKSQSRPPLGKSDHSAIFLMPKYKQSLKQEALVQREVDGPIGGRTSGDWMTDWDMFRPSSDNINEFTEAVVGFIGKLEDDTVQKTIIRTFPNQKPLVDKTIRYALKSCSGACRQGTWTNTKLHPITCIEQWTQQSNIIVKKLESLFHQSSKSMCKDKEQSRTTKHH